MSRHCTIAIVLVLASQAVWPAPAPRALAQCQRVKIIDSYGAPNDLFALSVEIKGEQVAIGAPLDDPQGSNSGSVATLLVSAPTVLHQLVRPGGGVGDGFGRTVSLDESYLVVAVRGEVQADVFQGSVESGWVRTSVLSPWDGHTENLFGQCASLDGDTIVVGAPMDTNENGGRAGAAYVFERDPNGVWVEKQKLIASDGQPADAFGQTVAVDGDVIVVGAPEDDDLGFATGSAYVFERDSNSGVWIEVNKLLPTVYNGGLVQFGSAVAVDGTVAVIGAYASNFGETATGLAYSYERRLEDVGASWELTQLLTPTNVTAFEEFGKSVALDGNRAVIGAWWADSHSTQSGAAYAFERDPNTGVWTQTAKLVPLDGQAYDEFGYSVALSGTTAVVGAWKDDDMGTDSGSAYIFDLAGGDCNANGWCDDVDIASGTSQDANANGVPDECDCWGDLDASGVIDLADLSALLTNFGLPSGMQYSDGDLDADGDVDLADLSALLERYGVACP